MSAVAGIVDFEVRLPQGRITVGDIQRMSGLSEADVRAVVHCQEIPVMEEGETAWELAVDVAEEVLQRNDIPRDMVGEVIVAGTGEWLPPLWSPAAGIADELGLLDAHCYEIVNFCNSSTTGIRAAVDAITLGRSTYVLLVFADQLSSTVDYTDPDSKSLFNFGEAVGVLLLGGEDAAFRVVSTAARTDPSWNGFYTGELGEERFVARRRSRRPGAVQAYVDNICALVETTLARLERPLDDVSRILVNHSNRTMHRMVLERLGLPADRSVFNYDHLGHMGSSDPFIALAGLLEEKQVQTGDLLLLVSSGAGFNWGVTAVEYVPDQPARGGT